VHSTGVIVNVGGLVAGLAFSTGGERESGESEGDREERKA
jgi:hypothetical protein